MSGLPEPGLPVFRRTEHEFLRLIAMVSPPWERFGGLVGPEFSWDYLREIALLHQLEGVVAWRLCDDRMDGIAPPIVWDSCQRHLDYLDGANRGWWEEVMGFCAALDAASIRYVVHGGPAQYAPLGITHFPRSWNDLDVDVDIATEAQAEEIAKMTGATLKPYFYGSWELILPGGAIIDLGAYAKNYIIETADGFTWKPWDLPLEQVSMLGHTVTVPAATLNVAFMAHGTWAAVNRRAARLPLWALARIAGWMQAPGFSMNRLEALLSASGDAGNRALWTLHIATRVYDSLIPSLAYEEPEVRAAGFNEDRAPTPRLYQYLRWKWPGDEQMLFDYQFCEGIEERVSAGLWERAAKPSEIVEIDADGRRGTVREITNDTMARGSLRRDGR